MRASLWQRLVARLRGRDLAAEYREWLRVSGRVADGRILESSESEGALHVYYRYTLANVDYETSHRLTDEQLARQHQYVPGATVRVRYDPRNPGSSLVE